MNGGASARQTSRVTRREAAKILSTSYENVKRLQRVGQLRSSPDRHGVHRFDRREVEELARRRGLQIKPSGELAATVFAMFKAKRSFEDIVIERVCDPLSRLERAYFRHEDGGPDCPAESTNPRRPRSRGRGASLSTGWSATLAVDGPRRQHASIAWRYLRRRIGPVPTSHRTWRPTS
jgi:hypothetical protein